MKHFPPRWTGLMALTALALCTGFVPGAQASEIATADIPETVTLADSTAPLLLNGAGLRTRFFVKVYAIALYLPARQTQAAQAIATTPRSIRLFLLRDLGAAKARDSFEQALRKNLSDQQWTQLQGALKPFFAALPDLKEKDRVALDFLADARTLLSVNDKKLTETQSAELQRALPLIWLGEQPADAALKGALLGKP